MKAFNHLLSSFTLLSLASSLFILLPLYEYPDDNFSGVASTIEAHPSVQWQIVINPSSGPGTTSSNPYPSSDYISWISRFNSYDNVELLGYVDTAFGNRPANDVTTDIASYAKWSDYPDASMNISMDGIFFDDVTVDTSDTNYTFYGDISAYARNYMPSNITPIIFNPGTPAITSGEQKYFDYCDTMVEFEDSASNYKNETTLDLIPTAHKAQSAVILHTFVGGDAIVESHVNTMTANGIEAMYLTSDCCYNAVNQTLLEQLVDAIANS